MILDGSVIIVCVRQLHQHQLQITLNPTVIGPTVNMKILVKIPLLHFNRHLFRKLERKWVACRGFLLYTHMCFYVCKGEGFWFWYFPVLWQLSKFMPPPPPTHTVACTSAWGCCGKWHEGETTGVRILSLMHMEALVYAMEECCTLPSVSYGFACNIGNLLLCGYRLGNYWNVIKEIKIVSLFDLRCVLFTQMLCFVVGLTLNVSMYLYNPQGGALCFSKLDYAVAWFIRESMTIYIFLSALWDPTISWRTGRYRLRCGGTAEEIIDV